jgi:hypothetical protein
LGSLEAFFATALGERVAPHTELFRITVAASDEIEEPVIETSELDMSSSVTWPRGFHVTRFDQQRDVREFYSELAAHVLGAACMVTDAKALFEELHADAAVQQRITMISVAPSSYSRVTAQNFHTLSDWEKVVRRSYPLREQRAEVPRMAPDHKAEEDDESDDADDVAPKIKSHRGISIRSVVDVHAWDRARWRGCGYLQMPGLQDPFMAFLFEDAAAARKIFERWRARFGEDDANEQIGISIIRHLPDTNPHHYCVQIASNDAVSCAAASRTPVLVATRSMTMEPENSRNLEMFLDGYRRVGGFYLMPAVGMARPEFFSDLAIRKRRLTVKSAADVREHDIEAAALRLRGLKVAS